MRYKCMICGGSIAGDNNKFCPYCGSESICQIENDSDVFQEGEVFTVFSEERKKEPNNINEQEKNSEKDEWSSDNRLENEKSEKKTKNRMVWTIAIIATVIIAIIGTLVFVSNREKNIEDGLGKESEKNNTNAGKGTFILEVKSSFTGDIKRWSLVEGTELTARTGSTFYLKREMEDKNVVSDGFSIMADDMELISIEGNAITVNNNNNYKKVQITVSVAGGEDLHFVMNVKKGGWNKEGNNHYYIDETDTRLTGWIQVIEDGNDHAYYLDENGVRVISKEIEFKTGDWRYICKLDSKGRLYDSWLMLDGKIYRYDENMRMIKNKTIKIGDNWYTFDEKGTWVQE